ncbi:MAG: hypothetical protein ACM3ML_00615 [Micromonosporaceae bacterium]
MRWIKVIALAIGVIVVFSVLSTILHALFWIGVGVAVAAVAIGVLKARSAMRGGRQVTSHDSGTRSAPPTPSPRALDVQPKPTMRPLDATADAARRHQEVEEELARLKRELE